MIEQIAGFIVYLTFENYKEYCPNMNKHKTTYIFFNSFSF